MRAVGGQGTTDEFALYAVYVGAEAPIPALSDFWLVYNGTDSSCILPPACGNSTIYAFVRAINVQGYTDGKVFNISIPVAALVTPPAPTVKATSWDQAELTIWPMQCAQDGSPTVRYSVQVATVTPRTAFATVAQVMIDTLNHQYYGPGPDPVIKILVSLNASVTYRARVVAQTSFSAITRNSPSTSWVSLAVVPDPPVNVTTSGGASRTVSLNWLAPTYNGRSNIVAYWIWISAVGQPLSAGLRVTENTTISGLLPEIPYTIRVGAQNSFGFSINSTATFVLNVLPDPPTSLALTAVDFLAATVVWVSPVYSGDSTLIKNFVELSESLSFSSFSANSTVASATSFSFSNLMFGTTYFVRIRAVNSNGTTLSDPFAFVTSSYPAIPSVPSLFVNSSSQPATILLTWLPVSYPSPLNQISVLYELSRGSSCNFGFDSTVLPFLVLYSGNVTTPSGQLQFLDTPPLGCEYLYRVRSIAPSVGSSDYSAFVYTDEFIESPSPPPPPSVRSVDANALLATWPAVNLSVSNGIPVVKYELQIKGVSYLDYEFAGLVNVTLFPNISSGLPPSLWFPTQTSFSYNITNLMGGAWYLVRMRTFTVFGVASNWSDPVNTTTLSACPGAINNYATRTTTLCLGRGMCNATGATCQCNSGYAGDGCELQCPGLVSLNLGLTSISYGCYGRGQCFFNSTSEQAACACNSGYEGSACEDTLVAPAATTLPYYLQTTVYFVWGVADVDMSGVNPADPTGKGLPAFDPSFNLSDGAAQQFMYKLCDTYLNASTGAASGVNSGKSLCPVLGFFKSTSNPIPLPYKQFNSLFGNFMIHNQDSDQQALVGIDTSTNGSAVWYAVSLLADFDNSLAGTEMHPYFNLWEDRMAYWNSIAPPSVGQGFQTSAQWVTMFTELEFISGTIQSVVISVSSAVGAMIVFTGNLWVSLYSCVVMAGIATFTMGSFVLLGMKLGAVEAVTISMVVGLSADIFGLHLGHAYVMAPFPDRRRRAKYSLLKMGSGVLSSGITSVGSVVFLVLCEVQLFVTFGRIVAVSMAVSVLFSLVLFVAMLAAFGPEGDSGNIKIWCLTVWTRLRECRDRTNTQQA